MRVSAAILSVVQIRKTETLLYVGVLSTPTRMGIDLRPCLRLEDKQVQCNGLLSRSALKQSPAVLVMGKGAMD